MGPFRLASAIEQVAGHLRAGVAEGVWRGEMPGALALAAELGVNHKTVEGALVVLEREGVLENRGARKPRGIVGLAAGGGRRSLRIGILLHGEEDRRADYVVEIFHRLVERGHAPFFAKRVLEDLGMEVARVAAMVRESPADGWLVLAASRAVLEWFAGGGVPVFGLFGYFRRLGVAGAGPDKGQAYGDVARELVGLGHRRIVLLARPQRRLPVPGRVERLFLRVLEQAGIEVGDYHFPLWEDTLDGFQRCLESLFRGSPPTALVVQETVLFGAVQQFLSARGLRVPGDVSLVCDDPDPTFAWRVPTVAHIRWDSGPLVRRAVRWAGAIARGMEDRRQLLSRAELVRGGTIGPPGRGR